MDRMHSAISFMRGWKYGHDYGVELTPRQISEQFPDSDSNTFAQGNIDGIQNDRFRLNLLRFGERKARQGVMLAYTDGSTVG
jgi:hypothetical protein